MSDELKAYIDAKIEYEIAGHVDTYHGGGTPDRTALSAAEKMLGGWIAPPETAKTRNRRPPHMSEGGSLEG